MTTMSLADAEGDVRRLYRGGFYCQLVSAAVWPSAAAVATWFSTGGAVAVLLLGGTLIFPLTWHVIRLTGAPASMPSGHPMAVLTRPRADALTHFFRWATARPRATRRQRITARRRPDVHPTGARPVMASGVCM